jgi:hypothetical protein
MKHSCQFKGMAPDSATPFICPVCKMVCELPANIESLPTNLYVMHIIQLNKNKEEENFQKWVTMFLSLVRYNLIYYFLLPNYQELV